MFSAANHEEDLTANAVEAIRLWAEDQLVPAASSHDEIVQREDVRKEMTKGAFLMRVPYIEDSTRIVCANVTFEKGMLDAIDTAARTRPDAIRLPCQLRAKGNRGCLKRQAAHQTTSSITRTPTAKTPNIIICLRA